MLWAWCTRAVAQDGCSRCLLLHKRSWRAGAHCACRAALFATTYRKEQVGSEVRWRAAHQGATTAALRQLVLEAGVCRPAVEEAPASPAAAQQEGAASVCAPAAEEAAGGQAAGSGVRGLARAVSKHYYEDYLKMATVGERTL